MKRSFDFGRTVNSNLNRHFTTLQYSEFRNRKTKNWIIQQAVNAVIVHVEFQLSDYATSMIGLCQEGKSSPDALRRSAGVNLFLILRRVCWPLGRGS